MLFGTIEQNWPQPYLMVIFGLSGRSEGPKGALGVETQRKVL